MLFWKDKVLNKPMKFVKYKGKQQKKGQIAISHRREKVFLYFLISKLFKRVSQHHFLQRNTMKRIKIDIKSTLMITYTLLDCLSFFSMREFIFSLYWGRGDWPKKVSYS